MENEVAYKLLNEAYKIAGNPAVKSNIKSAMDLLWPPSTLQVGLIGLCGRYSGLPAAQAASEQQAMTLATGITGDRIDIRFGSTGEAPTDAELSLIRLYTERGAKILPIYDPQPLGSRSLAQIAADMRQWASVLKECGITVVECGNEPYYEGLTAAKYAVIYAAMQGGLAGTGINVLAKGWGDYYTGTSWSQCVSGNGWCVDFCKALGGLPWAWAEHYYGAQDASGVLGGGNPAGWGSLATMQKYRLEHGLTRPLYITETGQEAPQQVSEAEQALNLQARIKEAAATSGVEALYIFCSKGGGYGLWTSAFTARPAVASVKSAVAALS